MKTNIIILFYLLFCQIFSGFTQETAIIGGFNIGGPIPEKISDSSSGKPIPGIHVGFSYTYKFSDRFWLTPEIYYAYKGVDYGQSFTRDTLVPITLFGVPAEVPSFYTVNVNGSIRLHSIDIPLLFSYRIGKFKFCLGPYFSFVFGGKDTGNVRVVVGEGGFFDDYTETYNNIKNIRVFESGIIAGFNVPIYKRFFTELKVTRSFTGLYKSDAPNRGNGSNKMFNTYLFLSLGYSFFKKN